MLLAALPATPVQLAHACYRFGFEIVVPASWGDELVAHAVLEDLRERGREPVIQCTCPFVSERLLAHGKHLLPSMVQTAPPPVAAARYARHVLSPREVRITYIGACPGAHHSAIDQRYLPDEFLQELDELDIAVSDMPTVFDSVLPPDRRRFVSLPGGCPTQEALWQASDGRMLREVTQPTFSTDLAQTLVWREYVMIDVAPSLGCACAGSYSRLGTRFGRVAVTALEPPRATHTVVAFQPDFAAPTVDAPPVHEPAPAPEALNGGEPAAPIGEPTAPAEHAFTQTSHAEQPADAQASASRIRARTPPSSPLPRAYLAKRRHLATVAREPSPHVESFVAEARVVEPERHRVESTPSEAPNEASDAARPIALHVEPETTTGAVEDPVPVPVEDQASVSVQVPATPPAVATEIEVTVHVATAVEVVDAPLADEPPPPPESDAHAERAPWENPNAAALDEPPLAYERAANPMRVEVEIFEESEQEPEVVVPDSVRSEEGLKPAEPVVEVVTQPVRPWGDVLIALWLVLVASAVIASLIWRR